MSNHYTDTTATRPSHATRRPPLAQLQQVGSVLARRLYEEATDREYDLPPFVVISAARLAAPFIVELPAWSDDAGKAFVHARWLPSLCLAVDADALAFVSAAWNVPNPTMHPHEPQPSEHPRRTEVVSVAGVSQKGRTLMTIAEVTRGRGRGPSLSAFVNASDVNVSARGWMSEAHAAAVGCFMPEYVEQTQPVFVPWLSRHILASDSAIDDVCERLTTFVESASGVDTRYIESIGLVCRADTEAELDAVRAIAAEYGTEKDLEVDELGYILFTDALIRPFMRAGVAAQQVLDTNASEVKNCEAYLQHAISAWEYAVGEDVSDDQLVILGLKALHEYGVTVAVPVVGSEDGGTTSAANSPFQKHKQSRNSRCRCGSGLKAKRCCG